MRRIHKGLVVAVSTVALAAAGCTSQTGTSPSTSAASSGGAKGTLTLGATLDIQGWDPAEPARLPELGARGGLGHARQVRRER